MIREITCPRSIVSVVQSSLLRDLVGHELFSGGGMIAVSCRSRSTTSIKASVRFLAGSIDALRHRRERLLVRLEVLISTPTHPCVSHQALEPSTTSIVKDAAKRQYGRPQLLFVKANNLHHFEPTARGLARQYSSSQAPQPVTDEMVQQKRHS